MSRILSQSFVWIGSATHSTSDAFRQRQRERIRIAQGFNSSPVSSGTTDEVSAEAPFSSAPRNETGDSRERPAPIRRMQNNDAAGVERNQLRSAELDADNNHRNLASGTERSPTAASPHSPFARKEGK